MVVGVEAAVSRGISNKLSSYVVWRSFVFSQWMAPRHIVQSETRRGLSRYLSQLLLTVVSSHILLSTV